MLAGWNKQSLLKLFAHEELTVDAKYAGTITVPPSINFVFTNHPRLFQDGNNYNLKSRLFFLELNAEVGCD